MKESFPAKNSTLKSMNTAFRVSKCFCYGLDGSLQYFLKLILPESSSENRRNWNLNSGYRFKEHLYRPRSGFQALDEQDIRSIELQ